MEKTSILAHRGLFSSESEKNSRQALTRALDEGFGIETDIRDLDGKVVISHDPPLSSLTPPSFEWLLEQIGLAPSNCRIALNIKSDGLFKTIESMMLKHNARVERFFVFDMSIPDTLPYLSGGIPVYSRISDYEHVAPFLERVRGIWIDNFGGSFLQVERAKQLLEQGVRVTIVSPELHRRDHKSLWENIIESGIYLSPLFEICTDFPLEAANRFCEA